MQAPAPLTFLRFLTYIRAMASSVIQTAPLSPYHLGKAREQYTLFNVFNALSWSFLIGNVITLFAMRLEFSATELGMLNALTYVAFFFLPLGKILTKRFSIIRMADSGTARTMELYSPGAF